MGRTRILAVEFVPKYSTRSRSRLHSVNTRESTASYLSMRRLGAWELVSFRWAYPLLRQILAPSFPLRSFIDRQ